MREQRRICKDCKTKPTRNVGRKDDKAVYGNTCSACYEATYRKGRDRGYRPDSKKYRHGKKSKCELCGFSAKHPCQLDVDHKDGNHSNDSPNNLQTLCANCHRLKTYEHREGMYKELI